MNTKTVLIPTDFTSISKVAYEHGSMLAAKTGSKLSILHVVEKQEEVNAAQKKLEAEVEYIKSKSPILKVDTLVRIGSIFEDIGHTATEIGAEFIVMGTHGKKGWQHVTGSRALKVVTNSKVPFIIVQNKGLMDNKGYDDIVVPMDLHKDTKQKLEHVAKLAQYFNSKVHVIVPTETDDFFVNKIKSNIIFAKKYLGEHNVACDFKHAHKGKNFVKEIVRYASEINADLISIMNHNDESFHFFGLDSFEESLITNDAEIAVMCVNPKDSMIVGGSVFSN
jgi:nucleotide-binding universal stress UspA family protein